MRRAAKLLVAAAALLAALLLGELGLRLWNPPPVRLFDARLRGTPGERVMTIDPTYATHPRNGIYTQDRDLGYRPVLGGAEYAQHGARWNDYPLVKPPGVRRLLFLGDSVTQRARLLEALRGPLGPGVELWNAGVIGYATRQELEYYRRYLGEIRPDHVVLSFHLNDYETTPITFLDGERFVAVYAGSARPHPWLLRHSFLYRFFWSRGLGASSAERSRAVEQEVAQALEELDRLVRQRGARFSVLVLPWFLPEPEWSELLRRHHAQTLALLEQLGIRHYAFLDTLARAVADGVALQETPGDVQHPSAAFAQRLAEDLLAQGFEP
jgi:hypothetical protein